MITLDIIILKFKIQELQDRKKINRLLSLAGVNENEVTYFIKEPPGNKNKKK